MLVKTPYPGIGQEQAPRESWPWMDACIEMQVGHDEWLVIVSDPAADEVGPDGEIESSWCYRGSDEITGRWW